MLLTPVWSAGEWWAQQQGRMGFDSGLLLAVSSSLIPGSFDSRVFFAELQTTRSSCPGDRKLASAGIYSSLSTDRDSSGIGLHWAVPSPDPLLPCQHRLVRAATYTKEHPGAMCPLGLSSADGQRWPWNWAVRTSELSSLGLPCNSAPGTSLGDGSCFLWAFFWH